MKIREYYNKFILKASRINGGTPSVAQLMKYAVSGVTDYIIFGSSISDYFELGFYNLPFNEKKTYLTNRFASKFAFSLDSGDEIKRHHSKKFEFDALKEFYKRDQLYTTSMTYDDFVIFTEKHSRFIYKPDTNDCGEGIDIFDIKEYSDPSEVYQLVTKVPAVIEELVIQNKKLSELCPGSVNTIRVISAKVDNEVTIMAAALRLGSGTSVVDNFSAGGMVAAIDLNTGKLLGDAVDHNGIHYQEHPYSHMQFKGFQIPNWKTVFELVNAAAQAYDLNYVGWDVAIRENDSVLIEANPKPMIHVYQIAGAGGKKAIFKEVYKKWLDVK